jgi:hypothetical protein
MAKIKKASNKQTSTKRALANIYFNKKHPSSFSSVTKLVKSTKKRVTRKTAERWLSGTDAYTLHKPVKRKFRRRKYIVSGIDSLWQTDLTDLSSIKASNDNFKYILFVIDVFSRKAFVRAIKSKASQDVTDAFMDIIETSNRRPIYLESDRGKEFLNNRFQQMLKDNKIIFYNTYNQETKASYVERLQRTIKDKLFRYFTYSGTTRYIDVLAEFVNNYNNSHHSGIKMKPNAVSFQNQEKVWNEQYFPDNQSSAVMLFKFNLGDSVRVTKFKSTFSKGYQQLWSSEIFTVVKRHNTSPPVYTLSDHNGELIKGKWYENEMQKVTVNDDVYRVEKILGKRKVNGKTQYLVRWQGYDKQFDSYVDKNNLILDYKN